MSNSKIHKVKLMDEYVSLKFSPYNFQISLAKASLENKNNIICVRTGSGKTLISAMIARYWYEKYSKEDKLSEFKVVFIVPTRNLVSQQIKVFEKAFDSEELQEITENFTSLKISSCFERKKVLFMTPQKLINAINLSCLTLEQISIIFFDECHHTNDNHPYNKIMEIFYTSMLKKKPLIIGLTASLGVGKDPLDHLISLCANLNSKIISSIKCQNDQNDLDSNIPSPLNDKIITVQINRDLNFTMNLAQNFSIKIAGLCKLESNEINLGRSEYEQFIFDKKSLAASSINHNLTIVVNYLNEFNLFYQRCQDFPIEFCIEKLNEFNEIKVEEPTKTKVSCYSLTLDFIKLISQRKIFNPKLEILVDTILTYHRQNSRGLVLVRTRNHTKALKNYLNQNDKIKSANIKCDSLVGLGNVDGISMNENQQNELINVFNKGFINLLVATDIAQEGLDIPACNYVIRYEFVSNEIGTVQSRGRSRASNGQCLLITLSGSINEQREYENRYKEKIMHQTIEKLNKMDVKDFEIQFQYKISQFDKILFKKAIEEIIKQDQVQKKKLIDASEVDIHCRDCGKLLFNGKKLKFKEPSYYSLCDNFIKNLVITDSGKGKFYCATKSCNRELGRLVPIRNSKPLYMIEIKAIVFNLPNNEMKPYSKWSKVTNEIKIEDL